MKNLDLALTITGKFEGHNLFTNVSDNFDGMGVSAGILQWNFGMGSLQTKILAEYMKTNSDLDHHFPEPIAQLVKQGTNEQDIVWVKDHMLQDDGVHLDPVWTKAWRDFMGLPSVIEIQKRACDGVSTRAQQIQSTLGLTSVRSYCWAFDIVTQNGDLKGLRLDNPDRDLAKTLIRMPLVSTPCRSIWAELIGLATNESVSLFLLSYRRAKLANPRWFQDVFSRKGTIALGKGYVHDENCDFSGKF